jgi:hypothetical protein
MQSYIEIHNHTPLLQVKIHPTIASETEHSTITSEAMDWYTVVASLAKVEGLKSIVHRSNVTYRFNFLI